MRNRITEMLKIRHPIALGGMAGVTDAPLVAAVSEAGGLGTLGAFKETAESLQRQIRRLHTLTQNPFAVNVPLVVPQAPELISVVLENRVPVVVTAAGNPATYTRRLLDAGIQVLHVVPCVDQARRAEDAGVNAVIAEGCESGGFGSPFEIGTIALVPQVVDAVKIPVLAAGGIADARGFAACLILGAEGASVGTAFLLTKEARRVGSAWRREMLEAGDTSTKIAARGVAPFRMLINSCSKPFEDKVAAGASRRDIVGEMIDTDWSGDQDAVFTCGQGVGLLHEVRTVKEVIDEFVNGAESLFRSMCPKETP
ncbi:MAG TPA: nitronate monooxygenase [Syntrophales bacterium]|nr:nitronate monooxygenase [Syntrophales bacterium]